ncbi:hypothetical protein KY334_03715 [Candidatus Woesearchaeota archaeon]|nr:hypothetical protein [Candidatus Woesearchaeota archaeon]
MKIIIKPNLMKNLLFNLIKFSIPGFIIFLLLFMAKSSEFIESQKIFVFFVACDIFLFSSLALFIFIFEQNKKVILDGDLIEYDDLFENRVLDVKNVLSYDFEEGIIRKFKLNIKNETFTINYVEYNPEVNNFKNQSKKEKPKEKPIKLETREEKENRLAEEYFKHKRKKQIDDIIKGVKKIELPEELKVNTRKPKPLKDFLGVNELKYKAEKEFPEFKEDEDLEDVFESLKKMDVGEPEKDKEEKDVFKKLKNLK